MSRDTGILIVLAGSAYVIELLFVPFEVHYSDGLARELGYDFLFWPPESHGRGEVVIRWDWVAIEILATTAVVGWWYFLTLILGKDASARK